MATVIRESAVIGGNFGLVKPSVNIDCGPGSDFVCVHLGHGLNKQDPDHNAAAFRIDGQVTLAGTGVPSGVEVAFLQFVRFNFLGVFYAGRKRSEGSIGILVHEALSKKVLLDPNPPMPPWISENPFTQAGNLAKNAMGDHPFFQAPRIAPLNEKTGVPNFLFHMVDDRDFWTVFSVLEAGKFQHLSNIHWHVRHDQKFNWRKNVPVPLVASSAFTVENPTSGAPTDPDLQTLLAKPAPPNAKGELKAAFAIAVIPPNPHRSDNDTRFFNVPQDFFQ
jgi:hypothetical protein